MTTVPVHGVVREVMHYFLQHPTAADTLEGIARWRLLERRARDVVTETDAAVAVLVEQNILEEICAHGLPPLYRLNPEKIEDARRLMEERA